MLDVAWLYIHLLERCGLKFSQRSTENVSRWRHVLEKNKYSDESELHKLEIFVWLSKRVTSFPWSSTGIKKSQLASLGFSRTTGELLLFGFYVVKISTTISSIIAPLLYLSFKFFQDFELHFHFLTLLIET